jgi:hypothetical protein
MPDPTARDYFEQQQDRHELAEAVFKLGSFINQYSPLSLQRSQVLALAILENADCSGCVSAARAARLLAEADDA